MPLENLMSGVLHFFYNVTNNYGFAIILLNLDSDILSFKWEIPLTFIWA